MNILKNPVKTMFVGMGLTAVAVMVANKRNNDEIIGAVGDLSRSITLFQSVIARTGVELDEFERIAWNELRTRLKSWGDGEIPI